MLTHLIFFFFHGASGSEDEVTQLNLVDVGFRDVRDGVEFRAIVDVPHQEVRDLA